jgi:Tfp pilus assembly protein PilV
MKTTLTCSLMLAAALGLAACDQKSEDKTQDAREHAEQAQKQMDSAQESLNAAAKENAKAADDHADAKAAKAEEDKTFVPTSPLPEGPKATQKP